jgi:hypothetical protein
MSRRARRQDDCAIVVLMSVSFPAVHLVTS